MVKNITYTQKFISISAKIGDRNTNFFGKSNSLNIWMVSLIYFHSLVIMLMILLDDNNGDYKMMGNTSKL